MLLLILGLAFADTPGKDSIESLPLAPPLFLPVSHDDLFPLSEAAIAPIASDESIDLMEVPPESLRSVEGLSSSTLFPTPGSDGLLRTGSPVAQELVPASFTDVPLGVVDMMLGPFRDASQLLPARLDPFKHRDESPAVPSLLGEKPAGTNSFSVAEQVKLLGAFPGSVPTPPAAPDAKPAWKIQIEAGGNFRQGNVAANNVNSTFRAERVSAKTSFLTTFGAVYNNNGVDTPNQRLYGQALLDRNMRGAWLSYGREELDSDRAALVLVRSVTSFGLGYKFINKLNERLIARTGPTVSYINFQDPTQDDQFRSGWMAEGDYRRLIGKAARVEWTSTMYPDFTTDQQFRVRTDLAVVFPIGGVTSAWNWKIGARHFYQLNPVPGAVPNDIETYFTLLYSK